MNVGGDDGDEDEQEIDEDNDDDDALLPSWPPQESMP